jgi:hypothetical protein
VDQYDAFNIITINAASLVRVEDTFPTNEVSGIIGSELEEHTYPNAQRPQDATWKDESLEYTSGGTNAVYSHSIAQSITDPETNQLETETNDVLAFDEAAGEAQWVPAEDLEFNPQAIQQIQAAAQLVLPLEFECGAVIFQLTEPAAAGITVSLAQLGTHLLLMVQQVTNLLRIPMNTIRLLSRPHKMSVTLQCHLL